LSYIPLVERHRIRAVARGSSSLHPCVEGFFSRISKLKILSLLNQEIQQRPQLRCEACTYTATKLSRQNMTSMHVHFGAHAGKASRYGRARLMTASQRCRSANDNQIAVTYLCPVAILLSAAELIVGHPLQACAPGTAGQLMP